MPKKNLKDSPRLAVIVSDLHAGSAFGLMPSGFHTKNGNEIGLNDVQKWLLECWGDCWEWFYGLAGKDKWSLILNGDLIDGDHHGTTEIFSNDESDHGVAAFHLLKKPTLNAHSTYIITGTESHTKGHEHSIAYQLKAEGANIVMPHGRLGAWPSLNIEFAKTYCKFDHHITTSTRPHLEASALSIHFAAERTELSRAKQRVPTVVGRAHRHKFGLFNDGYGLIFTSPPWQTLTRFGRKVVPHAVPQVGIVVLDWRHTEDNEIPVVHTRLHTIKQSQIIYA